jgi:hypothetical protein
MKLKTIIAATAAIVFAGNVAAQATSGSSLNEASGGTYIGALPVGIVANPLLRDTLQAIQLDASCVGSNAKACMPSISTIELASILQGGFGETWNNYGISTFGDAANALASAAVCGTIDSDEATRVAARHVGIGCTDANPNAAFNGVAGLLTLPQANTVSCLTAVEQFSAGAIGFATADSADTSYRFVKLDGESPDLANFIAGNYAMFADVHGGSLTGNTTTQPFGETGAVAAASNPPMHASAGNYSLSNECAAGRLRSNAAAGDLAN